jgi:glycosyltransferase involved in cell wall biosynthesis
MLSHYYPPERGAPQTRLHETAIGLQRRGHSVTVLTGPPHYPSGRTQPGYSPWRPRRERLDDVEVVRLPVVVRPNRGTVDRSIDQLSFAAAAMSAAPLVRRADVVLVDSPPLFLGVTAAWFRTALRRPYLFHVADPWPDYPIQMGALRNAALVRTARAIESLAYRHASLITTVSPGLVRLLDEHPAACGKVRHLPNGVQVNRFLPDYPAGAARQELGWPEAALTLVYVGSVGLAQGVDTLIEAVAPLRDKGVVAHIVGDGYERDRLAADVARRGLDHIRFAEAVSGDRVPLMLAAADAVVVLLRPGWLNEHALPTKLVEGLAAGRPIVVSADGDAAAVAAAGAGVAARAGDADALRQAIERLDDRDSRVVMGSRARELASSTYDRERIVAVLETYLREVSSDPSAGAPR